MNKKIGVGIVAMVLVVGALFLRNTGEPTPAPAANTEANAARAENSLETARLIEDGEYLVNVQESILKWEGRKTLIENYVDTGTLTVKDGAFVIKDGVVSEGSFIFDMTTIKPLTTGKNSGEAFLEKHLKSDAFFDVEKFPASTFEVKEVVAGTVPFSYTIRGALTVKGKTNEIEFPATAYMKEEKLVVEAATEIDRTKWDIRFGSDKFFDNLANNVIDDYFTLSFTLVAQK